MQTTLENNKEETKKKLLKNAKTNKDKENVTCFQKQCMLLTRAALQHMQLLHCVTAPGSNLATPPKSQSKESILKD